MKPVALIGGANGFIGQALRAKLMGKGMKVYSVTRNKTKDLDLTWNDLERDGLPIDVTHIVNLAGTPISKMSLKFWNDKYFNDYMYDLLASRALGNKALVKCITDKQCKANVKAFVCASAIGIYRPYPFDTVFTESWTYERGTYIQHLCAKVEECARIPQRDDIRQIQARFGVVLGRDGGMLKNIEQQYRMGFGCRIDTGKQYLSWIHMDDAVNLLEHMLFKPNVKSGPFNVTAPNPVRQEEFAETFAECLGTSVSRLLQMRVFQMLMSSMFELVFRGRLELLFAGVKVLPQRAIDEGYQFLYPDLRSALESLYPLPDIHDWKKRQRMRPQ